LVDGLVDAKLLERLEVGVGVGVGVRARIRARVRVRGRVHLERAVESREGGDPPQQPHVDG
tara:strand:- start:50 stop:232 length:183 start_codon:yes stop_codon:yes gene_type:complete